MSAESHNEEKRCPNCGTVADKNYCPQCGQATHLHKDTFWGMVTHFVGHYFHYDSKFWQTMKDLLKYPGRLTIAYIEKKRARYLPPISLYIFVSILFFLFANIIDPFYEQLGMDESADSNYEIELSEEIVNSQYTATQWDSLRQSYIDSSNKVIGYSVYTIKRIFEDNNFSTALEGKVDAFLPKVFFFMIPFMTAILKLFFVRRKGTNLIHHAVYALHYHSFFFIVLLFYYCFPPMIPIGKDGAMFPFSDYLFFGVLIWTFIYSVRAQQRVYNLAWLRASFYTIIIGTIYITILLLSIFTLAIIVAANM